MATVSSLNHNNHSFDPYRILSERERAESAAIYLDHIENDLSKKRGSDTYVRVELDALKWLRRESGIDKGTFNSKEQYDLLVAKKQAFMNEFSITNKDLGEGISAYLQYFVCTIQAFQDGSKMQAISDNINQNIRPFLQIVINRDVSFYSREFFQVVKNGPDRSQYSLYASSSHKQLNSSFDFGLAEVLEKIKIGIQYANSLQKSERLDIANLLVKSKIQQDPWMVILPAFDKSQMKNLREETYHLLSAFLFDLALIKNTGGKWNKDVYKMLAFKYKGYGQAKVDDLFGCLK